MENVENKQENQQALNDCFAEMLYDDLKCFMLDFYSIEDANNKVLSSDDNKFFVQQNLISTLSYSDNSLIVYFESSFERFITNQNFSFEKRLNNYCLQVKSEEDVKLVKQVYGNIMQYFGYVYFNPPVSKKIRPLSKIVDNDGNKIGVYKKGKWLDLENNEIASFINVDGCIFLEKDNKKYAYINKNNEIVSLDNKYLGTIKNKVLPIVAVIMLAIIYIMLPISSFMISRIGENFREPVLYISEFDGSVWEKNHQINTMFNSSLGTNLIAPNNKGSYSFYFENKNSTSINFELNFSEVNEYGINLKYKLKRDGTYIGNKDEYVSASELSTVESLSIQSKSISLFVIEWYWIDDDDIDTNAGINGATYTFNISITSWFSEK